MIISLKLFVWFNIFVNFVSSFTSVTTKDQLATELFTEDFVLHYCGLEPSKECIASESSLSRSLKMVKYYNYGPVIIGKISSALNTTSWKKDMMGGTMAWYGKESLLQSYADDSRVKTICEIGFNTGVSMMNFLVSNPKARIISFDIFEHIYSTAAYSGLKEMFPGRDILTIAEDSQYSVPSFHSLMRKEYNRNLNDKFKEIGEDDNYPLCQLIFIDGGHTSAQFLADLVNMKLLADPSFHTVIVDDFEWQEVNDSYYEFLELVPSFVETVEVVNDLYLYPDLNWHPSEDGKQIIFNAAIKAGGPSSMLIAKYVF